MPDTTAASTDLTTQRLWSLDTLRGLDMFWIIGGDALFRLLAKNTGWGWADALSAETFKTLSDAVAAALRAVGADECAHHFASCGYGDY